MGSRVVPLGIPTNVMNANIERHETQDSKPPILLDGEKYSLLSTRDSILNPGPLGSPLRRDSIHDSSAAHLELPELDKLLKKHGTTSSIQFVPFTNLIIDHSDAGFMGSPLKMFLDEEPDLEEGKLLKDNKLLVGPVRVHNQALLSGLAYCLSSCSMILVNKFVLSGYDFSAGISLMLYQNFVSVIIVSILGLSGMITTERLTWRLIRVWLPVNFIFVGMLITSMFSLKHINVAMVTILKNVTNVITALGETYLFGKYHDTKVWTSLVLMIVSAISGGITDLSFNATGYIWQFFNCILTASYSLTLRRVMETAKQATKSGNLNEFSMVLLNNTLSLPLGLFLVLAFNEIDYLTTTPLMKEPMFWIVITSSGFLGLAISFTSMWFLHQTSATTYSLVGSLNKIPLSLAGILLFHVPTSLKNSMSILFGLLAGIFFAKAKMR